MKKFILAVFSALFLCSPALAADGDADYATDTTNFADGLSTNIKVQIVSGHGSDLMTMYYVTANKE